jgi:cysteine synthase A
VIDRMMSVPDDGSIATARWASEALGRRVGGSTGTNLWGALRLVAEMRAQRQAGSVVTLLCDGGDRYSGTYYNDEWLADKGLDLSRAEGILNDFVATGEWAQ